MAGVLEDIGAGYGARSSALISEFSRGFTAWEGHCFGGFMITCVCMEMGWSQKILGGRYCIHVLEELDSTYTRCEDLGMNLGLRQWQHMFLTIILLV